MPRAVASLLLASLACCACGAQQAIPATPSMNGSAAVTPTLPGTELAVFVSKALLAFSPGGLAPALTESGTIDRKVGSSKESGSISLKSDTAGLETETWTLASGQRSFAKTAFTGTRTCSAQVAGKSIDAQVDLGCARIVPWFAPWNSLPEISSQFTTATLVTTSADKDKGLVRLRFVPAYGDLTSVPTKRLKAIALIMQAGSTDVLYDAVTALPKRVEYRVESDGDPATAIEVASEFSEYRLDSGFMVPHRVQRYLQRTLEADIHITNVTTE